MSYLPSPDSNAFSIQRKHIFFFSALVLTILAVNLLQVHFVRDFGWDDGSITVAYARTYAETGRTALTPVSEQVEGFSSPAWFWLLAACYKLAHPGFLGMLQVSQVLASLCSALACGVFYLLLYRRIGAPMAMLAGLALGLSNMFLYEDANGMEMSLLSLLVAICIVAVQRKHSLLLILATALATTVRFEAAFYLWCAGVAIFLSANRQSKRMGVQIAASTVLAWLGVELWRLVAFHTFMPNTVFAKRWAPYTRHGMAAVWSHLGGLLGLYDCLAVLIAGVLWLYFTQDVAHFRLDESTTGETSSLLSNDSLRFCVGYAVGVTFFNFIIGTNSGYRGRMYYSCFIPAILLVFYLFLSYRRRLPAAWTAFVLVLWWASTFAINYRYLDFHEAWSLALRSDGLGTTVPPSNVLERFLLHYRVPYGSNMYGITPHQFAMTGRAVDDIRKQLDMPTITFMVPDVGGASLCCENIRIVDAGLLTNTVLAHDGYAALSQVLTAENPEVIETHIPWSRAGKIYRIPQFTDHYSPVIYHDNFFWVRNDILHRLENIQTFTEISLPDALTRKARYLNETSETSNYDYEHLQSLGKTVTFFQ
ncbi:MAG: hypothetical protein ACLGQX_06530 [Acidobacteriota bacterium]